MNRKQTTRVIFHHSLSPDVSASEIKKWHLARGFSDIGYHYVIRRDGEIEIGRQINEVGAHARGKNADSIGVCVTGDFRTNRPTTEQIKSGAALYVQLCRDQFKKNLHIQFHRKLDNQNPCPGILFDRVAFEKHLRAGMARTKGESMNYDLNKTMGKAVKEGVTVSASTVFLMKFLLERLLDVHVSTEATMQFSAAVGVLAGAIRGAFNWWKHRK